MPKSELLINKLWA